MTRKYKLVFQETTEFSIYYTNEYFEDENFITFTDNSKKITYNKKFLVKKVEILEDVK